MSKQELTNKVLAYINYVKSLNTAYDNNQILEIKINAVKVLNNVLDKVNSLEYNLSSSKLEQIASVVDAKSLYLLRQTTDAIIEIKNKNNTKLSELLQNKVNTALNVKEDKNDVKETFEIKVDLSNKALESINKWISEE